MGHIGGVDSSQSWELGVPRQQAAQNMAVAAAQPDYPRATFIALIPGWVQTDMGGADATLALDASVDWMRRTIARAYRHRHVPFLDYDGTPFKGW